MLEYIVIGWMFTLKNYYSTSDTAVNVQHTPSTRTLRQAQKNVSSSLGLVLRSFQFFPKSKWQWRMNILGQFRTLSATEDTQERRFPELLQSGASTRGCVFTVRKVFTGGLTTTCRLLSRVFLMDFLNGRIHCMFIVSCIVFTEFDTYWNM